MEGGKGGGAGAYWPGFVDALTNVVIAMIFVIVVLAVALSFAAQLMGKRVAEKILAEAAAKAAAAQARPAAEPPSALTEESALAGVKRIPVAAMAAASQVVGAKLKPVRNLLRLDYAQGAALLDEQATEAFVKALKGAPRDQRVSIVAAGPDMSLSANQRMAFQRVMAVRNVLIAQGWASGRIDSRIDLDARANSAVVDVSFGKTP